MPSHVPHPERDISAAILLAFFVLVVPAIFLTVLSESSPLDHDWQNPLFQGFLQTCSGALALIVGLWLHRESKLNPHPAVMTLGVGFTLLSSFFLIGAWLRDYYYVVSLGVMVALWTVCFSTAGALLIVWRPLRRAVRAVSRPFFFWSCGLLLLAGYFTAAILYSRANAHDYGRLLETSHNAGKLIIAWNAATVLVLVGIYLKRRTSVVLSFTLAQYVFGLAVASWVLGRPWHLLWWYGHGLYFVSLFLVAYGILEANRIRERELLIADLAALSRKLEEGSLRDALTGCYNRRYIMEALATEFLRSQRYGTPLTLLVADADNFKQVNDTYGHPAGDFVLQELASRMRALMRASDVLARCGGEEFYIMLAHVNHEGGSELAKKLLEAVRGRPFEHGALSIPVTLSIGLADTRTPGVTDVPSLIEAADRALYAAKRAGKDRAAIADEIESARYI